MGGGLERVGAREWHGREARGSSEEGGLRRGRDSKRRPQMEGLLKEEEGLEREGLEGPGLRNGKGLRDPRVWKEVDLRETRATAERIGPCSILRNSLNEARILEKNIYIYVYVSLNL